ncbi:MAG: hypothetical protein MUC58_11640 [Rhizobiaceae bacterium]|jgi:hypothetical protein|nr:hypothetical protein [Rhizobiaceae bacterium]
MTTLPDPKELDELMQSEMRLEALKSHGEAWASGISAGIEPRILADAALYTALHEMIRADGESAALALVDRLRDRILSGEFEPERTRH